MSNMSATDVPKTPPRPTATLQPPTPIVPKLAKSQPYTSTHAERDENITNMWYEISRKVIGPMPAALFLDKFLPLHDDKLETLPAFDEGELKRMMKAQSEIKMYDPFIKAFSQCCPKLLLVDCHATPFDEFEAREIKPDICVYDDKFVSQEDSNSSKLSFEKVGILGEFKFFDNDDPFCDDASDFERTNNQARDTLGQITTYATAHASAQFRTHVFSLLVFPKYARLLFWDRSGVVVTEKINFEDKASILAQFFWRYQNVSNAKRGSDETVQKLLEPELTELRNIPDARPWLEENADSHRLHYITFSDGKKFAISAPCYMGTGSPTGRSTRTFKALCMKTGRTVFLKDTWRVVSPGLLPEHEVYAKLAEAEVPHVATLDTFDDDLGQVTRTQEFEDEVWVKFEGTRRLRKFRHYRLVLREYARPIQSFKNVKELVKAFRDALKAHRIAYDEAHILHRDISVGNILITNDGRGLLVDWDLSKFLSEDAEAESPPERTGTWQFMAARLIMLNKPGTPPPTPDRDDDLESFWHVLLWVALRHCDHGLPPSTIIAYLHDLFDSVYSDETGQKKGGAYKRASLKSQDPVTVMGLRSLALKRILIALAEVLASRYFDEEDSDDILKAEDMWKVPLSDFNPSEIENALQYHLRKNRQTTLNTKGWMEVIFDDALKSPTKDWDTGSANIDRSFPRFASEARKRKRESEIHYLNDSRKQLKPSDLERMAE